MLMLNGQNQNHTIYPGEGKSCDGQGGNLHTELKGCLAGSVGRVHASRLQGHETEPHVCCRVYLKLTN